MTRLLELRTRYNLSLRKMADGAKVSYGGLSFMERGERNARGSSLKNVATYFAVSTDYLLDDSDKGFYIKVLPFNSIIEVSQKQLDDLIDMGICKETVFPNGINRVIEYLTPEALNYINGTGGKVKQETKPEDINPYWSKYMALAPSDREAVNIMIDALSKNKNKN